MNKYTELQFERRIRRLERACQGVNVLTVLLVVFVTLKLCDLIAWPWWQVLLPLWLPMAAAAAVTLIARAVKP